MATFDGFSKNLVKFLKQLQKNNNRDWFAENKSRYESEVLFPALEFIGAMQSPFKKVSPYFKVIPKRMGGSLMRVYRDTRFSKDKTPYKTNVGIHFRHEAGKDVHAPGFYFHIDPKEVFVGAGVWHPDGPTIKKIRTHIVQESNAWNRITNSKKLLATFERYGESLKRAPRDFEADHPLIDDLKRKDHILMMNLKHSDLQNKDLVNQVTGLFKQTKPYVRFLCDALRLPC